MITDPATIILICILGIVTTILILVFFAKIVVRIKEGRKETLKRKFRLIPFSLINGLFLKLDGNDRDQAEARYYYSGDELEEVLLNLESDSEIEKEIKKLDLDFKKGLIQELDYEKQRATLLEEPWILAKLVPHPQNPLSGYFEVDWNQYFIQQLEKKGYKGSSDEEIVDQWLKVLHANQLYESGFLNVDEIAEESPKTKRTQLDSGKAEYS